MGLAPRLSGNEVGQRPRWVEAGAYPVGGSGRQAQRVRLPAAALRDRRRDVQDDARHGADSGGAHRRCAVRDGRDRAQGWRKPAPPPAHERTRAAALSIAEGKKRGQTAGRALFTARTGEVRVEARPRNFYGNEDHGPSLKIRADGQFYGVTMVSALNAGIELNMLNPLSRA